MNGNFPRLVAISLLDLNHKTFLYISQLFSNKYVTKDKDIPNNMLVFSDFWQYVISIPGF